MDHQEMVKVSYAILRYFMPVPVQYLATCMIADGYIWRISTSAGEKEMEANRNLPSVMMLPSKVSTTAGR